MSTTTTEVFTPGDLVISVYGDGDGSGTYADNQASPIVLEQINSLTGAEVPITGVNNGTLTANGELVLPQTSITNAAGVTEFAVSGEYGSSSEGTLELSADGQSLVIAGYAINAQTFNNDEAGIADSGSGGTYDNEALAQSTSVQGGTYPAVARAIADISYSGTVDSSTALYNIDNTNNPRSVATVNGDSFYISGQGVSGDTTQGVFLAKDGASSATAIDTSTDTRTVEIYNGQLYVSRDSKQPKGGGTSNVSTYGTGLPTTATSPKVLTGISQTMKLTAAQENTVNSSAVGTSIHISPENFFFANATTLYIADGGNPKQGGLGDGGLQKWTLSNGTWTLDYTMSQGLNLVPDSATSGTTGLIGLTGVVVGNTVQLYATNATVGDTDPTYLYSITDTLNATTAPAGATFTQLVAAAADTNIRGVAFAPTEEEVPCFCHGTRVLTPHGEVPVERLAVGDEVMTLAGEAKPLTWIGRGRSLVTAANPGARPIVVRQDALADGVPTCDLFLTKGHSLLLDGVLIPVEFLINERSIAWDETARVVEFYHLELEHHDVLLADGAAAESYRDDGNRHLFHNADAPVHAQPDMPAYAPVLTGGPAVDAVWAKLLARAGGGVTELTEDADLHLLADGMRVEGTTEGLVHRFRLDRIPFELRIRSRVCNPTRLGTVRDARDLGVAIRRLVLRGDGAELVLHYDSPWLREGFNGAEPGEAIRWTTGDAGVPGRVLAAFDGPVELELGLGMTTRYAPPSAERDSPMPVSIAA